ncbi:extracellular matrix protein 1 [Pempheris klunzingeri]|uniref:extracellular matrix protein 1 n=1 Tax=Pempheris klunzingeri TaxID=3127111 RepID=UPI00398018C4
MGSSWALVSAAAFLLVLLSSASKDEHIVEQREVTFDIDKIMQEMQQPDPFMLQKEVDLADILDPKEFPIEQAMMPSPEQYDTLSDRYQGSRPGGLTPGGRRPGFGPRSFGGPPFLDYRVQFPVGRPTSDNLQAICLHGDHRPRYPDSYFPDSGFGQQRRRASAVNKAESWFSMCCKGNQTWEREVMLCCATQAWELSVKSFCEEDSSVKDRLYDCCRLTGSDRLNCFHNDAPNPNYGPTEELPVPPLPLDAIFNFDPSTCQRSVMTPYSIIRKHKKKKEKKPSAAQKPDINFPPGKPTAGVIESLCSNQKLRPLYTIKCLPGEGFEWLARQAKTINRIEKGFKHCCKKDQDVLNCADGKWREELDKFCLGEKGKKVDFHCCSVDRANDRYSCFQDSSPDPHYNTTSTTEDVSLNKICETHKIIKKKFPVGFPLKNIVTQCCPLSEQDKTACIGQRLEEMSENWCSLRKASPPAVRQCCSGPQSPQCISKILTDAITKATKVPRQKKKKRCPLS